MKLQLSEEWFENRIRPDEDFDVGAGVPAVKISGNDRNCFWFKRESAKTKIVPGLRPSDSEE